MELVVISGKGGTGKTTIAAAISELEKEVIKIDCDVDAPNLYLLYKGEDIESSQFFGGKKAVKNEGLCIECGKCEEVCRFDAITNYKINVLSCEGCGACTLVCPTNAIYLKEEKAADTYVTKCNEDILVRAQMEIGSDGSGKLITQLRQKGKEYNADGKLIVIDGSPGIGCPVISSVTNCDGALIVTEPTKSGIEDLKRVVSLCDYFKIQKMICINKYDINEEVCKEIEIYAKEQKISIVGKVPFDTKVMESINSLKPITSYKESIANQAIEKMWTEIRKKLFQGKKNKEA